MNGYVVPNIHAYMLADATVTRPRFRKQPALAPPIRQACMLSGRATRASYWHITAVSNRVRRVVHVHSEPMAPKRASEGKEGPSKKAKTEAPSFDPKWKSVKPSMLLFGDDEPGCDKVAAFDLDGTLIEWKQGQSFCLEPGSWVWFNDTVPAKLKVCELRILSTVSGARI